MDANEIGKKIKSLRVAKGLKQKELAKCLNVSDKLISKWETGISVPSTEFTLDICKFFEVDVNEFLGVGSIKKSEKKQLSKKAKHFLYIIGGIFSAYLLFSLIYFVLMPLCFKNVWLRDIDWRIQNIMDSGYYSFEISTKAGNNKNTQKESAKLENGVLYYERLTAGGYPRVVIVDDIEYNGIGMDDYRPFNQKIENLADIIFYSDKDDDMANLVKDIDAKYIIKTFKGYKMVVNNLATGVVGKTIAEFIFEGKYLKELKLDFRLETDGKTYDCTGKLTFDLKASAPQITLPEMKYPEWEIDESVNLDSCTEAQLGGQITKATIDDKGDIITAGNKVVFYDKNSIRVYDAKNLTKLGEFQIEENIFKESLNNYFATSNHLYITTLAISHNEEEKVLKINLTNGTSEVLTFSDPVKDEVKVETYEHFYVSPNGNIYYRTNHKESNKIIYKTRNHTTGNYLIGDVFYCDQEYVYTITNRFDTAGVSGVCAIRKYDFEDNLIETIVNENLYLLNFVGYENGVFYFDKGWVENNFANYQEYFNINIYITTVLAKLGDRLFCKQGILFTDKFKPPIVINGISNVYMLDNGVVIKSSNNVFYSVVNVEND